MSKKSSSPTKLAVRKSSVRLLAPEVLNQVVGGGGHIKKPTSTVITTDR